MKICVYGAARDEIDDLYKEAAREFGRSIAARGHVMIFGGGARGVMGAAARGAAGAGAGIVSIAPASIKPEEGEFEGSTYRIRTETLAERKACFIELADAFAVLPGGIGTYDEFFDLISVKRLNEWTDAGASGHTPAPGGQECGKGCLTAPSLIPCSQKPVAIYNINGCYDALRDLLERAIADNFAGGWTRDLYTFCETESEMWKCLEAFPEECCDASEISDCDYERWRAAGKKGFWQTFIENNSH